VANRKSYHSAARGAPSIEAAAAVAEDGPLKIEAAASADGFRARASREQVRLWFLAQKNPTQTTYHMAYRLNLRGTIDIGRIRCAVDMLQGRHETLRTRFDFDGETVFQIVADQAPARIETVDLSNSAAEDQPGLVERLCEEFALEPIALDQAPLFRCRVIRLAEDRAALVFAMHHIIGDGWSHAVLTSDFCQGYLLAGREPGARLDPLPLQFADFSEHQNERLKSEEIGQQVRFWAERLEGLQALDLPIAIACDQPFRAQHCSWLIEGQDLVRLKQYAAEGGVLLSAILLTAYERALALMSGQDDYFLGIVAANRKDFDVSEIIGFFANTLLVPASAVLSSSIDEVLAGNQQVMIDIQENQEAPLDHVIDSLNLVRNPHEDAPVQALFVLQNAPFQEVTIAGLDIDVERVRIGPAKVPVTLFATERNHALEIEIEFDPGRVSREFASDLLWLVREELATLAGTGREPRNMGTMILSGADEPSRCQQTVVDLIWRQAQLQPRAIALQSVGSSLTYAELTQRAEAIARGLLARGVRPGERVCTMLERDVDLFAALLGIMRGAMIWAPVDPDVPEVFLASQLDAINPARIIAKAALPDDARRLALADVEAIGGSAPLPFPEPAMAAYAIGTSGSSGVPKVVLVGHAGLANVCSWIADTLRLGPADKGIWKTTVVFDAVMRELFPVLLAGGTLVVGRADAQRDMSILREQIETSGISTLHCVPTQLRALADLGPLPLCLRAIMSGGEPLPRDLAHRIVAGAPTAVYNVYGPTEATVDVTFHPVSGDETTTIIPIGRPVPNVQLAMVSGDRILPLTARGEIAVGGCAVAHGYLSADTRHRFRPVEPLGRAYLTGDLAVVAPDGSLVYEGRIDRQIKINGERLEPGAIEAELLREPGVGEAEIALLKGERGEFAGFLFPRTTGTGAPDEMLALSDGSDWQAVFDDSYRDVDYLIAPENNTLGWISSATGEPIPSHEVLDVLEDAAQKIRRWQPNRILELGCGIGTLAFRLIESCQDFLGVDFSASAVDYCRHHATEKGLTTARFEVADIREFAVGLEGEFDAIVINSVVQYLPSQAAFERLLDSLLPRLARDGFIFIGDVRDARLRDVNAFWKTRQRRGDEVHCQELLLTSLIESLSDTELLLNPDELHSWASRNGLAPPLLEPKYCDHDNELVNFRFDSTFCRTGSGRRIVSLTTAESIPNSPFVREHALIGAAIRSPTNQPFAKCYAHVASVEPRGVSERTSKAASGKRTVATITSDPASIQVHAIDQSVGLAACAAALGYAPGREPTDRLHLPNPNRLKPADWRGFLNLVGTMPQRLGERLPRRLIPQRLIPFPYYPTLPNGKKDQQTIVRTARAIPRSSAVEYPVQGSIEEKIAVVFQNLIGTRFALDDDFFAFGGSSLVATQACNRLQRDLGISIALRLLFEASTPRLLAARISNAQQHDRETPMPRDAGAPLALSHAQRRLWFIERLGVARPVYNIAHAVSLSGRLNLAALDRAIGALCQRHVTLRSTFVEINGEPQIRIAPPRSAGNIEVISGCQSSADAIAILDREQNKHFDLERGPLFRVIALPTGPDQTILCLICHHIVSDGWSMAVAMHELGMLYEAEADNRDVQLDEIKVDYLDLALHDKSAARQSQFAEQVEYWQKAMEDAPLRLTLPYDRLPTGRRSWAGDKIIFDIEPDLADKVSRLALEIRATPFIILLAAFHVMLRNQSQMNDTVIGTVLANRNSFESEKLVGFLVNSLALRIRSETADSFRRIASHTRDVALQGFDNQDVPFEMVLESLSVERVADYQAVFQVLFALQNNSEVPVGLGGLPGERLRLPPIGAMFDLSLELRPRNQGYEAELEYSSELFDRSTALRLAGHFTHVLTQCLAKPDAPVDEFLDIPAEEKQRLLRFGHGQDLTPPAFGTICQHVQAICDEDPERLCLIDGEHRLTYGEVVEAAKNLADQLDRAECCPGTAIAISVRRGPLVVIAILAAQWVGASPAYIDPTYPESRKHQLMQLAHCRFAIVEEDEKLLLMQVGEGYASHVEPTGRHRDDGGKARCTPEDAAFLAFTSGTTGSSKVVQVSHRAVCGRLQANDMVLGYINARDRFAHCYSFNYDGGLVCAFWPITRGVPIEFVPLSLLSDASALGDFCTERAISIFDAIPIVVETLVRSPSEIPSLRLVVTGGDSCPEDLFARLRASGRQAAFANQYGPCEAVINATTAYYPVGAEPHQKVNIGRPIPGCDIFIVDSRGALAPIGVIGEIWIGGPYLSDGYINDDDANSTKFVQTAFAGQAQRVFRSGDRGRWLENGEMEFAGRVDRQVQINGMRVELGEVEAALRLLPEVQQAVVLVAGREDVPTLSAFVVPDEAHAADLSMAHDWQSAFDNLYAASTSPERELLDFTGWSQTASGEAIAPDEMRDWLNDTIDTIMALRPEKILEIGSGLGLIALSLANRVDDYVATDISAAALDALTNKAAFHGLKLRTFQAAATDVGRILVGQSFDVIVINSVAQYLSGYDELHSLIGSLTPMLCPDGAFFVGDVRDLRKSDRFYRMVEKERSPEIDEATVAQRIFQARLQDEEAHFHPEAFVRIARECGLASPIIRHKPLTINNEMINFRFDAILPRRRYADQAARVIPQPLENDADLADMLATATGAVAVSEIPFFDDRNAAAKSGYLQTALSVADARQWVREILPDASGDGTCSFFMASDIQRSALWLSYVGDSGFSGALANRPNFSARTRDMRGTIRTALEKVLPGHMIPPVMVFLDRLPAKPGGKIDEALLKSLLVADRAGGDRYRREDLVMAAMTDLWRRLLKVDTLFPDSDFFAFGGHSLLAAKLVADIRREFGVQLPVVSIFELRTLRRITAALFQSVSPVEISGGNSTAARRRIVLDRLVRNQRQYALWNEAMDLGAAHFGTVIRLGRPLPAGALSAAVKALANRHPVLEWRFDDKGKLTDDRPERPLLFLYGEGADAGICPQVGTALTVSDGVFAIDAAVSCHQVNEIVFRARADFLDGGSLQQLLRELVEYVTHERKDQLEPVSYPSHMEWRAAVNDLQLSEPKDQKEAASFRGRVGSWVTAQHSLDATAVAALEDRARSWQVTTPALLLGGFASLFREMEIQTQIDCAMDSRLHADDSGFFPVGPYADVLRFTIEHHGLLDSRSYAEACAEQLLEAFNPSHRSLHGSPASAAFSFRTTPDDVYFGHNQQIDVKANVSPSWNGIKLSCVRNATGLVMTLGYDLGIYRDFDHQTIFGRMVEGIE
jgi:amino acid adenylation domain-containing protein